jgi:protease IV
VNENRQKPSILPWVLFSIAFLGCIILGFFLIFSLVFNFIGTTSNYGISTGSGNLAVVEVKGVIDSSKDTVATLKDLEKDKQVRAIVLRVDSPGGAVAPSQEIYEKVKEVAKKKPIVVSMGSLAASGGYYISAPATRIIANPGTVTGSIGVLLEFFIVKDLLKKLYLDWRGIKSGEVKDMGSPLRDLSENEKKILSDIALNIHEQFKKAVSESRKIPAAKLNEIADGRIFSGEQALKLKLVDELGGLEKAITVASKLGGISGEPKVYYPRKSGKKFWEYMAEESASILIGKFQEKALGVQPLLLMSR